MGEGRKEGLCHTEGTGVKMAERKVCFEDIHQKCLAKGDPDSMVQGETPPLECKTWEGRALTSPVCCVIPRA